MTTTDELRSSMSSKTKADQRLHVLIAALNEREAAKIVQIAEDNPLVNHNLIDLAGGVGVAKSADHFPAVNMAAKAPNDPIAYDLESARIKAREEGKADKSAKRMAQAKARAERKIEFDKIADSPVVPDQGRMDRAWLVVFHMVGIVTMIAKSKQRWANRLLGSNADDIPQMALEKMALVLAKSTKDLTLLTRAAEELGDASKRTGQIPGDQLSEEERKERKEIRKARKWLMGMANNRVMGALVDSYTSQRNLRWDNLDLIATVMASINGVGEDPLYNRFKADRAPAFLGTRFQRPGGIDGNLLAMAVNAAITDRGLDPLVEFILNDEHRRVDGAVMWSKYAQDIFLLSPNEMSNGEILWQAVMQATEHIDRSRKARGDAAREHVRNLFEWLPSLIVSVVDAFDPHFVAYGTEGDRALIQSDWEIHYRPSEPSLREPLMPALKYATAEEAGRALVEHLAVLSTGADLVRSAVNA